MNKITVDSTTPVSIRFLPCDIGYIGPVNSPDPQSPPYTFSLYGKRVTGSKLDIPSPYIGRVFKLPATTSSFTSFTYYTTDTPPSPSDQLPQIMNYLELMEEFHS